jgi:hypothetical protein
MSDVYGPQFDLLGILMLLVPALMGAFWGAPLVARELEHGTHRLVWNQSITRTTWLARKLAVVLIVAVGLTGVLSFLLGWASVPMDSSGAGRFAAVSFSSRFLAPMGYAAFAVALGTLSGLILRRTLPAMAVTLVLFAAVQIAVPFLVRPHFMSPVVATMDLDQAALERIRSIGFECDDCSPERGVEPTTPFVVGNFDKPGAWMLTRSSRVRDAHGSYADATKAEACMLGEGKRGGSCIAGLDLEFTVRYHPSKRFWRFQWSELTMFLVLAGVVSGLSLWRVRSIRN